MPPLVMMPMARTSTISFSGAQLVSRNKDGWMEGVMQMDGFILCLLCWLRLCENIVFNRICVHQASLHFFIRFDGIYAHGFIHVWILVVLKDPSCALLELKRTKRRSKNQLCAPSFHPPLCHVSPPLFDLLNQHAYDNVGRMISVKSEVMYWIHEPPLHFSLSLPPPPLLNPFVSSLSSLPFSSLSRNSRRSLHSEPLD